MTEEFRCWAEVDLNALRENLAEIRNLAGPGKRVLTVVKADAYGHGLRQIAAVLMQSGTDVFGVANLAEARAIRSIGQGWPILMLGACLPSEVAVAVRDDVMPTLSSLEEARRFSAQGVKLHKTVAVHLKVDTGMGRLGVAPAELGALWSEIKRLPNLTVAGLYTHYSSAEDDPAFTKSQSTQFVAAVRQLLSQGAKFDWIHASNSAGLLLQTESVCNTVRPGLLVYGISPPRKSHAKLTQHGRFRPALAWKTRVTLVREVPTGTPISYGRQFVTKRRTRVATLGVGYGDGYFRAASNRARVLVAGCRCPVLGRVTMDQMMIDVSRAPQVQPGDEAVLIGEQLKSAITAAELAIWCKTVPWEVLTNITYRVPRVYKGGTAA